MVPNYTKLCYRLQLTAVTRDSKTKHILTLVICIGTYYSKFFFNIYVSIQVVFVRWSKFVYPHKKKIEKEILVRFYRHLRTLVALLEVNKKPI